MLDLNEQFVSVLSALNIGRFALLRGQCSLLRIAEVEGRVAGFLMGFRNGSSYDSINYQWFAQRFTDFLYIDRVVVGGDFHGQGIASRLYRDAIDWSRQNDLGSLVAEIDLEPPNEGSLQFHRKFGFLEVDQLTHSPGKRVSLQRLALAT